MVKPTLLTLKSNSDLTGVMCYELAESASAWVSNEQVETIPTA